MTELPWVTDPRVDACYAKLTDAEIVRTVPAGPGVNFDVDWTGRPVGIEVLGSADWSAQLVRLFLRGEVRLVHGFEDEPTPVTDVPARLRVCIEPRDAWIGFYVADDAVYMCPFPFVVFRWRRK